MLENINFNRNRLITLRTNITPIYIGVCFFLNTCILHAQNNIKLQEITQNLKSGKLYDEIDLSDLGLTEMPDLAAYSIKKLNLSHNNITKFKHEFLPNQLEILNISYNQIEPEVYIEGVHKCQRFNLKDMDISFNKVQFISLSCSLDKLKVNNNKLTYLGVGSRDLNYLNISNNPNLNPVLQFDPSKISTIKRQNIASENPLEFAYKKNKILCTFKVKSYTKERP